MEQTYRHELKYYINKGEARLLADRLSLVMDRDRNADQSGRYHIRSLYFDDLANTALLDKLSGVYERQKFRIRIYNFSQDVIKLECKKKAGTSIRKETLRITREQYDALVAGEPSFLLEYKSGVAQSMYYQVRNRRLKPCVVVDYTREAYVHPFQDVRVTLDRGLSSGPAGFDIFDPHLPTVGAMVDYDVILEVKFNAFLPEYFQSLIQLNSAQRSSVSKYILCRNFI